VFLAILGVEHLPDSTAIASNVGPSFGHAGCAPVPEWRARLLSLPCNPDSRTDTAADTTHDDWLALRAVLHE
jgi:hypothetical protein